MNWGNIVFWGTVASVAILFICWLAQSERRVSRLIWVHERLDQLDPSVRALTLEEEDERKGLLKELEDSNE